MKFLDRLFRRKPDPSREAVLLVEASYLDPLTVSDWTLDGYRAINQRLDVIIHSDGIISKYWKGLSGEEIGRSRYLGRLVRSDLKAKRRHDKEVQALKTAFLLAERLRARKDGA